MGTNFVNPFGAAISGMQETLNRHEMQRRNDVAEAEKAKELALKVEADNRAKAAAAMALQTQQAALDAQQRGQALSDIELAGAGGNLTGDAAARANKYLPFMVEPQTTAPALTPDEQNMPGPLDIPGGATDDQTAKIVKQDGSVRSKGTPKQQAIDHIMHTPTLSTREIAAALMGAGDNISTAEADMLAPKDKDVRVFRYNLKGDLEESKPDVGWTEHKGPLPEKYKLINERDPNQNQGNPYVGFSAVTGQGVLGLTFNKKTGQWEQTRIADNRPGAGDVKDLANALNVNDLIRDIKSEYDPAKIGVVMGRLKNLDQKYWGADADYAKLKQNLTTLGNTIIQLRTGAQMSVQEAERILSEIANETLPPTTFMARLNEMDKQYREYVAFRSQLAYGRTTAENVTDLTHGVVPTSPVTGASDTPRTPAAPEMEEYTVGGVKFRRPKGSK